MTEVWVPELQTWVLMDADYNLHFERDGRPQSVLDVHDALLDGTADRLRVVCGTWKDIRIRNGGHSDSGAL